MKKYYTFRAGKPVPKWMFTFTPNSDSRDDMLHNRHGKIIFMVSCIVIKSKDFDSVLFPISKSSWHKGVILASGLNNGNIDFHGLDIITEKQS